MKSPKFFSCAPNRHILPHFLYSFPVALPVSVSLPFWCVSFALYLFNRLSASPYLRAKDARVLLLPPFAPGCACRLTVAFLCGLGLVPLCACAAHSP